jgi:nitroimidazol reductase NimA-like FMN-containing flavoprotein (pyridoxamine 5'-phosphate oxidase superfamily)
MDRPAAIDLPPEERDARLGTGGTGTLAFAAGPDTPPHAVPVSYGYDADGPAFYFRLAADSESEKPPLDGAAVTFTTTGEADGWWSVVAQGALEAIDDVEDRTAALDGLGNTDIPLVDIFETDPGQVRFVFVRLVPETFTARTEEKGPV